GVDVHHHVVFAPAGAHTHGHLRLLYWLGGGSVMKPTFAMPARWQATTRRPTLSYRASWSPRMCTSGCGSLTASFFRSATSFSMSGMRLVFQYTSPSLLTASRMFSGLVCVGTLRSFGSSSWMLCVTTGIVIRKMI